MGCDIHAYVEYDYHTHQDGTPYWKCIMSDLGGRDYDFFSVLANCGRGSFQPLFPNRGLPEGDMSYTVEGQMWLTVTDDKDLAEEWGYCTEADADRWGEQYGQRTKAVGRDGERILRQVMHPDMHSHNWLTCEELSQVIAWWMVESHSDYPYGVEWDAALAAMRALEERGHKTRLIFAFDN